MESWGPHPSLESEKKLNLSLCLRPQNNVAKKKICNVLFVQVEKENALDVQNLLFFNF